MRSLPVRFALWLLVVFASVVYVDPVSAARLFTTGIEENDVSINTMWTATTGAPAASTVQVHSGTYAMRANVTAATAFVQRNLATNITTDGSNIYTRFYVYIASAPTGAAVVVHRLRNSGGAAVNSIQIETNRTVTVRNNVGTTTVTSSTALSTATWYRIEQRYLMSDTAVNPSGGEIEVRIYAGDFTTATEVFGIGNFTGGNGTDEDTMSTNTQQFQIGAVSSATTDLYFDDFAWNDTSGSFQTSWAGPGKIALLKPNGDTAVAWTKGGSAPAGTNFGGVSEVPGAPDDGVTYNFDSGSTNEDKLALTNLPAEVTSDAVLALLHVYARVSASASSGTMALKVWDESGTGTEGPTLTVSSTTWRILTTNEHQVYNLSGKTKANVDSFSGGYIAKSGAVEKRSTAWWVNVEWIEAAGSSVNFFNRRLQQ